MGEWGFLVKCFSCYLDFCYMLLYFVIVVVCFVIYLFVGGIFGRVLWVGSGRERGVLCKYCQNLFLYYVNIVFCFVLCKYCLDVVFLVF